MNLSELPMMGTGSAGLIFAVTAEGAVVTGCSPDVTQVVIPACHDGTPVVCIGPEAFLRHPHLLSVTLPDTVRVIGEGAFMGCRTLMRVLGGRGLERVQSHAFRECVNLQHVDFPSTPDGDLTAFAGCYQLEAANEPVTYR